MSLTTQSKNGWNCLSFAVLGRSLDVIDFLLFETSVDIESRDHWQLSAYIIAAHQNDPEILQLF